MKNQEIRERVAFSLSHPLNLPPQAAGGISYRLSFLLNKKPARKTFREKERRPQKIEQI